MRKRLSKLYMRSMREFMSLILMSIQWQDIYIMILILLANYRKGPC